MNNKPSADHVEDLRKLYHGNSTARAILDYFSSRERNATETKVETLEAALSIKGADHAYYPIMKVLKTLSKMGYCKFVSGRKGGKTRVVWRVGVVNLGLVAGGSQSEIEWFKSEALEHGDAVQVPEPMARQIGPPQLKRVVYPLRPELDAELFIPKDFAKKDADRLIDFIRTLPFDDTNK